MSDPHAELFVHIALSRALLCASCDSIYAMPRHLCPSCGSSSALVLGRILGERSTIVTGLRAFADMLTWAKTPGAALEANHEVHPSPI